MRLRIYHPRRSKKENAFIFLGKKKKGYKKGAQKGGQNQFLEFFEKEVGQKN